LLLGLLPLRSSALAELDTLAGACLGPLPASTTNCVFSRTPGPPAVATSSVSDTVTGTGIQIGRSASVTITDYGHFSATAGAGMDYTLAPEDTYGPQWQEARGIAYARFRDSLTATGAVGNGLIRMRWEIEGSNSFVNAGVNPLVITDVYAETRLVAICNSGTPLSHDCSSETLVFETNGPAAGTLTFDIPIVFGTPTGYLIALELHAFSGFRSANCDTPCIVDFHADVDADFGSTGRLVAVQLFDGASNELSPSSIASESGFDYDIGAPEPGSALLTGVGALVLGAAWAGPAGPRPVDGLRARRRPRSS
jgi:hypothetical protein